MNRLQNTRYEKGEEKNDPVLSEKWASFADVFVMDAFGSAHRAHASTVGVPELLKARGKEVALGFLVEKEIEALGRVVHIAKKDRPYIAVIGGFKVSDKIKVIETLLQKCDKVLIGGAMAYTFQVAQGHNIGISPFEPEQVDFAKKCLDTAGEKILLPVDAVATDAFQNWTKKITTTDSNIPDGFEGMDIGPKTQKLFADELSGPLMHKVGTTVVLNFPLRYKAMLDRDGNAVEPGALELGKHADVVLTGKDSDNFEFEVKLSLNYHMGTDNQAAFRDFFVTNADADIYFTGPLGAYNAINLAPFAFEGTLSLTPPVVS
jgi:hypothetical protein